MVILSNLPPPTEGVRLQQAQTSAILENQDLGSGTLYISESCVSWVGAQGNGFSLQYPAISLHAISRDRSSYPEECLYVMVEAPAHERRIDKLQKRQKPSILCESMATEMAAWKLANDESKAKKSDSTAKEKVIPGTGGHVANGTSNEDTEEEQQEEDDTPITQIRFVPVDKSILDEVFKVMSDCQALHPDENESFSDEDPEEDEGAEVLEEEEEGAGNGEWYSSPEDVVRLNAEGQAVLNRVLGNQGDAAGEEAMDESDHAANNGQFEDA